MVTLRKANAYSKQRVHAFTRISKKKNKAYIKTVPPQKIVKFTMGKEQMYDAGKLPHQLTMISKEDVQIRHNALESCRQYINKKLDEELGGNYLFRVLPFPHHIQRENKMITGAGADRMQTGMQLSFGKSIGKAAIKKENAKIFFFALPTVKSVVSVRKIIKQVSSKLPCKTRTLYEEVKIL